MSATVRMSTPLGPVAVTVGAAASPDAETTGSHPATVDPGAAAPGPGASEPTAVTELPGGARVLVWSDVGGLVVDALVTPPAAYRHPSSRADFPETLWCAVELRLHALVDIGDVQVAARLADDAVRGERSSGEGLVAVEFSTPEWELAIGGPDDEVLVARAASDGEPASWRQTAPAIWWGAHGLVWDLPALGAAESARVHAAVAWCRAGHPSSDEAPWFAVDVTSADIRAAAGLAR